MNAKPAVLDLQPDAFLSLRDAKGATVTCAQGAIWITYERDRRDIVLYPGQCHEVTRRGGAIQALAASRVAIAPAGGVAAARTPAGGTAVPAFPASC